MKLKFLGKTVHSFSCQGQNLKAGDCADFSDALGKSILYHYGQDFQVVEDSKEHAAQENKMAKKTAKFKSKSA